MATAARRFHCAPRAKPTAFSPEGVSPVLQRAPIGERLQFAPPQLADEDDADVGAAQVLFAVVGDRQLSDLHHVVFDPEHLLGRERGVGVFDRRFVAQDRFAVRAQFRDALILTLGSRGEIRRSILGFERKVLDRIAHRMFVVDRDAEEQPLAGDELGLALRVRELRASADLIDVRHVEVGRIDDPAVGQLLERARAVFRLFDRTVGGASLKPGAAAQRLVVRVRDVTRIAGVVEPVEKIARPVFDQRRHFDHARLLEIGEAANRRRLTFAQVGEDEAEIVLRGIGAQANLRGKSRVLAWLLDALTGLVVLPAVIVTAQRIALNEAGREQRRAMRAVRLHHVHAPVLAAIYGDKFGHDLRRVRPPHVDVLRTAQGLPKAAQIPAGQRAGFGGVEIPVGDLRFAVDDVHTASGLKGQCFCRPKP